MEKKQKKERWVAVSGGFDPLHIGHVRLFQEAKKLGDKLVVILNNDNWLRGKKGYVFMPQEERVEMIEALSCVDKVVLTEHEENPQDMSVVASLRKLKPAVFANGGDRKKTNVPEDVLCEELGIETVYNVGRGGKVQSSSWMIQGASRPVMRTVRPWGEYFGWDKGEGWYLKTIYIKPGCRLSLQYHRHREEYWMLVAGDVTATLGTADGTHERRALKRGAVVHAEKGMQHRLESKNGGVLVEVSLGDFDEQDIVRLHDDYGRQDV